MILHIFSLIFSIYLFIKGWPEIKKYIPFLPKPFILFSYQQQDNNITFVIENIGNAPASYFKADVSATKSHFSIGKTSSDFVLTTAGQRGNLTTVSARNILPQQKGSIMVLFNQNSIQLEVPTVRSDSRYLFIGQIPKVIYN